MNEPRQHDPKKPRAPQQEQELRSPEHTPNPDLQREDAGSKASGQPEPAAPATPAERPMKQENKTGAERNR